ncbi:MAG: hypothetical protein LBI20_04030 [Holosporales bacterium]|nr:hypothetical protein [Holosporales bacterium]
MFSAYSIVPRSNFRTTDMRMKYQKMDCTNFFQRFDIMTCHSRDFT